jgi:zinc finger protein
MSTNCTHCGYKDNEVKSGSAISEKGKRITLKVEDAEDLARDILKASALSKSSERLIVDSYLPLQSESAGLTIPEISLTLTHGTLGGRFTTLEGILEQVYEELSEKALVGDSAEPSGKSSFEIFLSNLKELKSASKPFTVILDDPLANSYIQNIYAPGISCVISSPFVI